MQPLSPVLCHQSTYNAKLTNGSDVGGISVELQKETEVAFSTADVLTNLQRWLVAGPRDTCFVQ